MSGAVVAEIPSIHEEGAAERSVQVIQASGGWAALNLGELWARRELLYFLIWRDLKARYKQTVLGVSWAIIQPFFTMVVFSIVFGRLAALPSDGVPYPLFSYAALVPWTLFATALTRGSGSLVESASLISKVYFPRVVLPLAKVCAAGVDSLAAFAMLLLLMYLYGETPGMNVVLSPLFLALAASTALGVALWFSALNVFFRDVGHIVPFLTQVWLFATPIAYPSSLIPESWRLIAALNPMTAVVDGFRWALLCTDTAPGVGTIVSLLASLIILGSGILFFRRMERTFADVV